ncbi:MAG: pyocin knob domain-containing protein [Oscillospiraceae bacterium]|jgi:hypothetical protein|nr:pyocin knob domain-containing protein [Oscillospiraceae bacterium]
MSRWKCVLTAGGAALLASAPGNILRITKAVCGAGSVPENELANQTALTNSKQEMQITKLSAQENVSGIRLQLHNNGVGQAFDLRQIGIFGKLNQNPEDVLYMILQNDTPDVIPSENESPNYVYECLVNLILGGAESVEANVDTAAFSTVGHTHDAAEIISGTLPLNRGGTGAQDAAGARASLGAAAAVHSHTPGQVGLGNVDNTSDANKPVSTATQTALDAKIPKADIINNLTSTVTDKPLSAAQGKVLGDGKVPISRTVNGKALNVDITLTSSDVGAMPYSYTRIPAGSDLNTYITTGRYYYHYDDRDTIINVPSILSGTYCALYVSNVNGRVIQELVPTTNWSGARAFVRMGYLGEWSSWDEELRGTSVIDSLTSTNATRPLSAAQGKVLNDGKAPVSHSHSASNINSGTLPIVRGGTNATTQADALISLKAMGEFGDASPAQNLNNLKTTGIYFISSASGNLPSGSDIDYGILEVFKIDIFVIQRLTNLNNDPTPQMKTYQRGYRGDAWSNWKSITMS